MKKKHENALIACLHHQEDFNLFIKLIHLFQFLLILLLRLYIRDDAIEV